MEHSAPHAVPQTKLTAEASAILSPLRRRSGLPDDCYLGGENAMNVTDDFFQTSTFTARIPPIPSLQSLIESPGTGDGVCEKS